LGEITILGPGDEQKFSPEERRLAKAPLEWTMTIDYVSHSCMLGVTSEVAAKIHEMGAK
jgi:hypothetical protein